MCQGASQKREALATDSITAGAATPHVGSAWALPRSHPLWAPMDFEARQLAEPKDRSAELAKFEPPAVPRPELSAADVASLRCENVKRFQAQQLEPDSGRVEFIPCANFKGRKAGFYWGRGAPGGVAGDVGEPAAASTAESSFGDLRLGYHVDFAQMRHLMALSPGDRCEARYDKVRRMFRGAVLNAHDDDCSYDVRFEHGHVRHRVPAEHVLKSDWVGECKETDGIHRTLKAANPLLETKDAAVRWYEQVLLWEQGKVDRPTAPAAGGRYRAAAPAPAADLRGDAGPPPPEYETAVGGLTAPSTAAARDEAPSDDVAEASVEDASTHQPYSESSARTEDGGGCWDRFRLVGVPPAPPPDESGGVAERGPTAVVQTDMGASAAGDDITIQAVVASGDVWRPASAGYRHFWDADGRPRKRGPPTHLSWYGAADDAADSGPADVDTTENIPGMSAGEAPLEAQSDGAPLDLCGDGSLFKHSLRSGLARVVEAPFGGVSIVPRGHAERERAEQTDAPPLKGRRPVAGCLCTCHIIVTRLDGTAVESSYDSNSKRRRASSTTKSGARGAASPAVCRTTVRSLSAARDARRSSTARWSARQRRGRGTAILNVPRARTTPY
ncbi:hypothetical protein M885DRAFT_263937 [Pelagophyceae sp. CCMP2097]|nr:hypothetical protein M885DRAFT_263937 [Pelagophyceae sp. CCMP2097]